MWKSDGTSKQSNRTSQRNRTNKMVLGRPVNHNDHSNCSTDHDSPGGSSTTSKQRVGAKAVKKTALSFQMLPLERASSRGEKKTFSNATSGSSCGTSHYHLGSLRLELSEVQSILQEIIPKNSTDKDLVRLSKSVCKRMIARLSMSISLLDEEEHAGDDQIVDEMMMMSHGSHRMVDMCSFSALGNASMSTASSTRSSSRSSTTRGSSRSSLGISHNNNNNTTNSSYYWVGGGGDDWSEDVVSVISAFIDSSDSCSISASLLWLLHSTIGSIRMENHDNKSAIESFQRSLWILQKSSSSSSSHPHEELGLTLHRLAIAYGRSGDITQASGLLEKALANYNLGGANRTTGRSLLRGKNHNRQQLVSAATERLERYQRELQAVEKFAGRKHNLTSTASALSPPPPPPPLPEDSQSSPAGFFRRHVNALKEWKNQQKEG